MGRIFTMLLKTFKTKNGELAVATHTGLVRERNEDNFLVLDEQGVYVVADGMGGHASGELASRLGVECIAEFYQNKELRRKLRKVWVERIQNWKKNSPPPTFQSFYLCTAIEAANRTIYQTARKNRRHESMGTTLVATQFNHDGLVVAYVGDSRLYRYREGRLDLLSSDHSLVNEYLRLNMIKQEEAERFQHKNVILRALGMAAKVKTEIFHSDVVSGDRFLLCTDGLTDLVSDGEIRDIFTESRDVEINAQNMVQAANEAGGYDNTTVLVLAAEPEPKKQKDD
jgi:protein phosphatase